MVKQKVLPPLKSLVGCGRKLNVLCWAYGQVRRKLVTNMYHAQEVCGTLHIGKRNRPSHPLDMTKPTWTKRKVYLCEACAKREGIVW